MNKHLNPIMPFLNVSSVHANSPFLLKTIICVNPDLVYKIGTLVIYTDDDEYETVLLMMKTLDGMYTWHSHYFKLNSSSYIGSSKLV